jgi:hypothetical protein
MRYSFESVGKRGAVETNLRMRAQGLSAASQSAVSSVMSLLEAFPHDCWISLRMGGEVVKQKTPNDKPSYGDAYVELRIVNVLE